MQPKKIAVLFSGNGTNLHYLLKHLPSKYEIVVTLCNNPNAKGIEISKSFDVECIVIDSKRYSSREEFDRDIILALEPYDVDLVVLAGFMRVLGEEFTSEFKAINLHPSLLPRHKGLKAIEKSYQDEHEEGGVSVHFVNSELDGGEIILQKSIKKANLNFEEYDKFIREIEKEALVEAIEKVLG